LELILETSVKNTLRWLRIAIVLLVIGSLLSGGYWGSGWLIDFFVVNFGAAVQSHELHVMVAGVALFTVLMAIPYVPSIEISLALLAVFGPKVAIAIYTATLAALTLSYLIGRVLPLSLIAKLFGSLDLQRAKGLVQIFQPLSTEKKFKFLIKHAPKRVVPILLKHHYLAIMIVLNVPGNALIGGGGGIALAAGMSGLFTFPRFLASVSLAALPVPLVIILTGS
jgi:hypothetical protein